MDRRDFLQEVATSATFVAAAGAACQTASAAVTPNEKIAVAVVGVKGRGGALLQNFAGINEVEIRYVCDIDEAVLGKRMTEITKNGKHKPTGIKDFRQALDDKSLDAIVLGTPDHWHAIPTILACQARKDVYVEKPDGHNLIEGRTMVAAAKKHERVVQLGTQSRSSPHFHSALEYIRGGHLGKPVMARAWESGKQSSLGHPPDGEPPAGIDYDTWLGPAPKRPFNPLRFHGNWRWFYDYGTGDLGNDGVHRLDVARWAFETAIAAAGESPLGFPRRVCTVGGKYYFDDDQQWPDTLLVNYDYAGRVLMYEMRIWSPYPFEGYDEGAAVYGDKGYIVIGNTGWRAFGPKGKELQGDKGPMDEVGHAQNFLDCMRSRAKPNADLETIGHPSSILCHIGNVAWRVGRTVSFDPATYTFTDDAEANQYLTRPEYRAPWKLPKIEEL